MKLLEIVTMMDIKEHQQVQCIRFLIKKKESGISVAQELHEPIIKKPKERKVYARYKENI